ncbi:Pectinesterase 2 [Acorus calamus]|uniref:Pectinesterase n=1 Tax=Acorus calamus TaxID=4465 RepID=A0AAV9CJG8_ACOCL|nr:Pectinesterase 2 [Acorus calamus]
MQMSVKRLDQSLSALKGSPQESKQDIQTWLSAVLTYHDSCKDSIGDDPPNRSLISAQISSKMDYLSFLASNSLALANRIPDIPTTSTNTRRQAYEHVFPNWVSAEDRRALLDTNTIKADAVVAQDGTGDYKTISKAIKAASGGRFVIYVKAGTYKEKISTSTDNIMLVGDGKDATMITNDRSVGGGSTMPNSATFVITGDGFIAKDIGFSNTAGTAREQALAVRVASDHSVFYRCSFRGYQDTLYALSLRQFYRDCDIYGTIDFIFGNAAAVFQNCNIILRHPAKGHHNTILANGRTDPGQNTGFSLQKCRIRAGREFYPERHTVASYLGRPWKEYSRAVVMQSSMDDSIWRKGWDEWSGGFALKTLYFAEYANVGPGAGTAGRVGWAGYHVIGAGDAVAFTVGKFISGGSWLPSTGVDFDAGL